MKTEHDSHNLYCRSPFGAAKCGERVILRILISEEWPREVLLKYEFDGESFYKKMYYRETLFGAYVFEAGLSLPDAGCVLFYCFEISTDDGVFYYGNCPEGLGGKGTEYKKDPVMYQITVYKNDYHPPKWLREGIMYQIFPDRFNKSASFDPLGARSDIIKRSWGDTPYYLPEQFGGEYLANDFFGGSLRGITEKLDYLADLGIDIIYLNPIFEAYSNHKYDTGDYEKIDKMFGTEEDLFDLCKKAKEKGIRIILDGVFNHTGADSKYFNKYGKYDTVGAYQSRESEYYGWYDFKEYPEKYDCWWGIKSLPAVKEENASFRKYILSGEDAIVKRWIRKGISGWRLDVADELPEDFLRELRREVKAQAPNAAIIGEVWEDASNKVSYGKLRKYLCGEELDSAMNYPVKNAMTAFIMGKIGGEEFNKRIMSLYENYPKEAFLSMMNFLSSHDTARIFSALSGISPGEDRRAQAKVKIEGKLREITKKRFLLIYKLLMCMPGMPSVFYGDENAMEGFSDPFCRGCFEWDRQNGELLGFFKDIIRMRKKSDALCTGDYAPVYGQGPTAGFLRIAKEDIRFVILNTSPEFSWYAPVELGKFGISALSCNEEKLLSENGRFDIAVPPMSIKVYKAEKAEGIF